MKVLDVLNCTPKGSIGVTDTFLVVNIGHNKINFISLNIGCVVFEEDFETISELEQYITSSYTVEIIGNYKTK